MKRILLDHLVVVVVGFYTGVDLPPISDITEVLLFKVKKSIKKDDENENSQQSIKNNDS